MEYALTLFVMLIKYTISVKVVNLTQLLLSHNWTNGFRHVIQKSAHQMLEQKILVHSPLSFIFSCLYGA